MSSTCVNDDFIDARLEQSELENPNTKNINIVDVNQISPQYIPDLDPKLRTLELGSDSGWSLTVELSPNLRDVYTRLWIATLKAPLEGDLLSESDPRRELPVLKFSDRTEVISFEDFHPNTRQVELYVQQTVIFLEDGTLLFNEYTFPCQSVYFPYTLLAYYRGNIDKSEYEVCKEGASNLVWKNKAYRNSPPPSRFKVPIAPYDIEEELLKNRSLFELIRAQDVSSIRAMIQTGQSMDVYGPGKFFSLYVAVDVGNVDMVRLIASSLRRDAVNKPSQAGVTAFHRAVQKGYTEIAKMLATEFNANLNTTTPDGISPLINAILQKDEELVQFILDTAKASYDGERLVKFMLAVRTQYDTGAKVATPIIVAILKSTKNIVVMLHKAGASLDAERRSEGITDYPSLFYAVKILHDEGFAIRECESAGTYHFSSHIQGPESILYLSEVLFGQSPETHIVSISGYEWELGVDMCKHATENLDKAFNAFFDRQQKPEHNVNQLK